MHKLGAAGALILGVAIIGPSGPTLAQDSVESDSALEEVVVTARRRTEDLQRIPVSVTNFSAADIEQRSIFSIEDISNYTPNVTVGEYAGTGDAASAVYIRGIGQSDFRIFADPAVAMYVDGVFIPRSLGGLLELSDIQRIEVLRGPQGTLFGKNTVAGSVNIVSQQPHNEFEGYTRFSAGQYERYSVEGAVNVPFTDQFYARLSAKALTYDGYGHNPTHRNLNNEASGDSRRRNKDSFSGRAQLRWASERVTATVSIDASRRLSDGPLKHLTAMMPGGSQANGRDAVVIDNNLPLPLYADARMPTDAYESRTNAPEYAENKVIGTSLTLETSIGPVDFKSITSYRQLDNQVAIDVDGTEIPLFEQSEVNTQDQSSQEFQFSSLSMSDRLAWVAGLFFHQEEGSRDVTASLWDDLFVFGLQPASNFRRTVTRLKVNSWALFGQGTYTFNDQLSATLGVRYSDETKDFGGVRRHGHNEEITFDIDPDQAKTSWTSTSPRLSFEYQWTDSIMTYVSAAHGFKSGGFNGRITAASPVVEYDPETLWSYEIGARTELFDRHLRLNVTTFFSDYKDIQTISSVLTDEGVVTAVGNAAAAEMKGVEIDAQARLSDGFYINASVGFIDAEYTDISNATSLNDSSIFARTPEWSWSLGANYSLALENAATIILHVDVASEDESYSNSNPIVEQRIDSRTLANARVTYRSANDAWSLAAFVTNLTDEFYVTNRVNAVGAYGSQYELVGAPRQVGITYSLNF